MGSAIGERQRPSPAKGPAARPDAAARRSPTRLAPHVRSGRGPPSGLGHHGTPTRAQCPRGRVATAGARTRSGASCGQPRMRTQLARPGRTPRPGPSSDWMRDTGPLHRAAGRRACHSNQPASLVVDRGESRAQSQSGRRVRDQTPRFHERKRWKSHNTLECGGWRRGMPSCGRGGAGASPGAHPMAQPTPPSVPYHRAGV